MPITSDIGSTNPEASILLVADSGAGKTTFLGTIPDIFIVDTDAGVGTLRGKAVEYQTFKDAPFGMQTVNPTMKSRGFYKYGEAWPAFVKLLNEIGDKIDKGTWNGRPLGLDSLTTLMNLATNYVNKQNNRSPSDGLRIQDWGQLISLVETVIDQLTAWPIMLVATAHIQRDTNQMLDTVELLPLLPGKFAGKIGIYFNETYYIKVSGTGDDRKRALITQQSGMIKQAKTSYNVPDGSPADWAAISKYITG